MLHEDGTYNDTGVLFLERGRLNNRGWKRLFSPHLLAGVSDFITNG